MIETVDGQRGVARSSGEEGETTMTFGILIVSLRFIYKPRPDQTVGRGEESGCGFVWVIMQLIRISLVVVNVKRIATSETWRLTDGAGNVIEF